MRCLALSPQRTAAITNAEVNALIEARVGDYVTSTNVGNAYTVALDPVVTAYSTKTAFAFKASAANTGAVTEKNRVNPQERCQPTQHSESGTRWADMLKAAWSEGRLRHDGASRKRR